MKPIRWYSSSLVLLSCFLWNNVQAGCLEPRFIVDGLGGDSSFGRVDVLAPIYDRNYLVYLNGQGKYRIDENDWFGGLGLGARFMRCNRIYGGYLFVDQNKSEFGHHYTILNPGFEQISNCWDFHINGYIPLDRRNNEDRFFPSDPNTCGINGDCRFVEFQGHQQFEHQFLRFEETGPGVDLGLGVRFNNPLQFGCQSNCMQLQAGTYYYRLEDTSDIVGATARVIFPVNAKVALTAEASYDNYVHGTLVGGLRLQLGHTTSGCPNLCDRMYDPVYRNLGALDFGTSVPVRRSIKDEGLVLRRDNIFFFNELGSAQLGETDAGTFENPFSINQFTDATVASAGTFANFYFNPGTYIIDQGTVDNRVTLLEGQSIYGRSENYKCSAVGDERAILEGGIDLVNDSHVLDSIQLVNKSTILAGTGPQTVIGLSLADAHDVHLCNSVVDVQAIVAGATNVESNVAIGIVANDSEMSIYRSTVSAKALVGGDNNDNNVAIGIGNFNAGFSNNRFNIWQSNIISDAETLGSNDDQQLVAGIGAIGGGDAITPFDNNRFDIVCSTVRSFGTVGIDNDVNFITGIGNIAALGSVGNFTNNTFRITSSIISTESNIDGVNEGDGNILNTIGNIAFDTGTANFSNNNFLIVDSVISAFSNLEGINETFSLVNIIGNTSDLEALATFENNNFNISRTQLNSVNNLASDNLNIVSTSVIGNNAEVGLGIENGDFINNHFVINDSDLSSQVTMSVGNTFSKLTVIGNNVGPDSSSNFVNNQFEITCSNLTARHHVLDISGFANTSVIGNTNFLGTANFLNNQFLISSSNLIGLSTIDADNVDTNAVSVIGNSTALSAISSNFTGNVFSIDNSSLQGTVITTEENELSNEHTAVGIGNSNSALATSVFSDNQFDISCTNIKVAAIIGGDNLSTNTAVGIGSDGLTTFSGNQFNVTNGSIQALAQVGGDNTGSNLAFGVNANDSGAAGNEITLTNMLIEATAQVIGSNTGINRAVGLTALTNSIINIFDSIVNVRAFAAPGINEAIATQGNVVAENTVFNTFTSP